MYDTNNDPWWKQIIITIAAFLALGTYVMGLWEIGETLDIFEYAPNLLRDMYNTVLYLLILVLFGCLGALFSDSASYEKGSAAKKSMISAIVVAVYGMGIERLTGIIADNYSPALSIIFLFCALADLAYMAYDISATREKIIYESGYKSGYWSVIMPDLYKEKEDE